ncbi:BLUF domain-containing protein [Hymenobacter terricola]|uniref:BLUF domain-containing protein n=1 Tax=Hymenobacter terricola TaxID=2819236 RepID=UPI001B305DA2|nr:BLUF domain-containing protein [Hymenobacter terricola]
MVNHQIIYCSTNATSFSEQELVRLVQQARIFNLSQGITGILFFSGFQFLQVLEGEQNAVEELYDRICVDPRHSHVTTLLDEEVSRRLFPNWSMNFNHLSPAALTRLIGYLDPGYWATMVPRAYDAQQVISDLLGEFVQVS